MQRRRLTWRPAFRLMPSMSAFAFPFPVLVADIGGTNVRFALITTPGAAFSPFSKRFRRQCWRRELGHEGTEGI